MTMIRFRCDRCGRHVEGFHTASATAGFYRVDGDSPWAKYGREDEHFVCDACIQGSDEYRADYPPGLS